MGILLLTVNIAKRCHVHIRSRVYIIPQLPWERMVGPKSSVSIVM